MKKMTGDMCEKSRVVLLHCGSYESGQVYKVMREGIRLLGGFPSIIEKNEKILIKPNLVRKAEISRAVITHPAVVEAVVRLLREDGYEHLVCGDSCGIGSAGRTIAGTGMDGMLERYQVPVRDFEKPVRIAYPEGRQAKQFILAQDVLEADALINICKMKTHALERVTGAVKNMYGCVCGLHKAQGHTIYPNADSFARMLVDLNQRLKPRLYIMDGITAMEGNGPTSGDPVEMHVLLLSMDPVALDSVFCRLVHLDPELVPTNVHGAAAGLGTWKEEAIELITLEGEISMAEAVKRFGKPDFRVDREKYRKNIWNALHALKVFQKKPYIVADKCKKCGICVESCPVKGKALHFPDGRQNPPVYDYRKCIRCFCCQEMCPHKAIQVKKKGFGR